MTLEELTVEDILLALGSFDEDFDLDEARETLVSRYGGVDAVNMNWDELPYYLKDTVWDSANRKIVAAPPRVRDGLTYACVSDYGGEGMGETRYVVFSVTDGVDTRYFRKDGFYASYGGSTWDGEFSEVQPQERVVTVWE